MNLLRRVVTAAISVALLTTGAVGVASADDETLPPVPPVTETDPVPPVVETVAAGVTFVAPTLKWVGIPVSGKGQLTGFTGEVTVSAQVYSDGEWRTKRKVTVAEGQTSYTVELPHGLNTPGVYTWRVVALSSAQKATSDKAKVERIPLRAVTAKADRTKQIGKKVSATGKVTGFNTSVKVNAQVYVGGKWVTKKTVTVKAKYAGTSYTVELPYAVNSRGTKTWRVLVDDGTTTRKSAKFKVTRVADSIDSRCLTGRALCVSKKDRKVRWIVDGEIKKTFDARFGKSSTPTRNGAYKVYWKSRDHVSSLYDSPMPFAMFFSGGQAVHYSADFARNGYSGASHGCVNIRDYAGIKNLFNTVRVGDKVIVYG